MELHISKERLSDIISDLREFQGKRSCRKGDLLSLIGKLNFVSKVFWSGRTFICRLIECSKKAHHLHHKVKLTKSARLDIEWWLSYLPVWNGVSVMFDPHWTSNADLHLWTDASDTGYGGYYDGKWFCEVFNDDQKDLIKKNIAWREMLAIVQSLATWGNLLQGKKVLCHCDNSAVVSVIQKDSSKDKDLS